MNKLLISLIRLIHNDVDPPLMVFLLTNGLVFESLIWEQRCNRNLGQGRSTGRAKIHWFISNSLKSSITQSPPWAIHRLRPAAKSRSQSGKHPFTFPSFSTVTLLPGPHRMRSGLVVGTSPPGQGTHVKSLDGSSRPSLILSAKILFTSFLLSSSFFICSFSCFTLCLSRSSSSCLLASSVSFFSSSRSSANF